MKVKYVLPAAQMALAVVLLWLSIDTPLILPRVRYTSFDMHAVSCSGPMLWSEIMPRALTACFYLGWCIGVRWLFGSDFIYGVRRKIN